MHSKIFKRLITIFTAVSMFLIAIPIAADDDVISGSGSPEDPYLISNEEQLLLIKDFQDACYKLTSNIDIYSWSGNNFSGILDGDGYKITIKNLSNGFIYTNNGTIKNLSLYAKDDSSSPVLLVRNNYGTIENVHISGEIRSSKAYYMGSVATINYESGVISNSYSTAYVSYSGTIQSGSGVQCFGVFVGNNLGTIENCYWRDFCYQVEDFAGDNSGTITGCVLGGDYGKSDTAMKLQATYPNWDFNNTWKIDPDMNGGFPCLINEREFIKIPVEGVNLDNETIYLEPGESANLTADVFPSDAWDKSVEWSTSNPDAATVSQDGLITAKDIGDSIITVKTMDGGFEASCTVHVVIRVKQLELNYYDISIDNGESFSLVASVLPENATNKDIIWSSSEPLIASVDKGTVFGQKEGTAVIKAVSADGGASAECTVRILKPAKERFDLNSDGECNLYDAELLSRYVQGHTDTGLTAEKADTNGDGRVTSRDVTTLLQYIDNLKGGS